MQRCRRFLALCPRHSTSKSSLRTGTLFFSRGDPHTRISWKTFSTLAEDVAMMDAVALSRAARRALQEGDYAEERWQRYGDRAADMVDVLSVRDVAQLSSKFSTARLRNFDLYCRLSSRVMTCLDSSAECASEVSHVDLRLLSTAFGRSRSFDTELMERLVPLIVDRVQDFRPRELVRIIDAYARMPVQSPELFALVADALPPYLYDLEPPDLASIGRAFVEAAFYNAELTDALCDEVVRRLRSFGAQECLVFFESLARLQQGLPAELQRNDKDAIGAIVAHLAQTLGSLAASDLVRMFHALVLLDHYDPKLVHLKLCSAVAQKLEQISGPGAFSDLAELLHCLSLLPAQSHKSAELAMAAAAILRRHGHSHARVEPRIVAMAVAALAQLDQEDDTLEMLAALVHGRSAEGDVVHDSNEQRSSGVDMLRLATEEELEELHRAFGACRRSAAVVAHTVVGEELVRRRA